MKTPLLLSLPLALFAACGSSANADGSAGTVTEISNLGSDTLLEVAGALAEVYHDAHPEVAIAVSGGGSGRGVSQLIAGAVDIANCSRPFKDKELELAKANKVEPMQHTIGYDGIAVFVHKDNPIESLTLAQLKEIFGDGGKIDSWKALGIDLGEGLDEMQLGSRQNNSGTYECIREHVLDNGRFKQRCRTLNGSKDVVQFCADSKNAIGYSGIAYATADVKVVPIKRDDASPAVLPSNATVLDKSYAIARPLFMYTNGQPKGQIQAYLDWIKSDAGQQVLQKNGYVPLRLL